MRGSFSSGTASDSTCRTDSFTLRIRSAIAENGTAARPLTCTRWRSRLARDKRTKEAFNGRRGTLVAWTTQGFVPKQPYAGNETAATFEPFVFGLVQLGDVVRVEARVTETDPAKLQPGMELELTFVPFYTDEDGTEIVTWAFAPI